MQRLPIIVFALVMAAIPFIPGMPPFWIVLLDHIGLSALVAMGLVLLTGVGGLTSFGQAAFCGFGAYTTAVLTTAYGVSPWLTLPLSLLVSGAAAVLLGSRAAGRAAKLKPRARIRAFANVGSEPALMLTGPVDVTRKVLKKARMSFDDLDLIEVNEAFAAVVLRYLQAFDLDPAKVNVNGGAIAMGHPLGATGAMILGIALDELERRNLNVALVTLCIGAGMGTATIIERV